MNITITDITVLGDTLAIKWSDNQESYYQLEELRKACPCAHCQGEPDVLGKVEKPRLKPLPEIAYHIKAYELVGSYVLKITWQDNHSTGLYSFDYLRALPQ